MGGYLTLQQINIDPENHQFLDIFSGKSSSNPYLAGSMWIYQEATSKLNYHNQLYLYFPLFFPISPIWGPKLIVVLGPPSPSSPLYGSSEAPLRAQLLRDLRQREGLVAPRRCHQPRHGDGDVEVGSGRVGWSGESDDWWSAKPKKPEVVHYPKLSQNSWGNHKFQWEKSLFRLGHFQ